MTVDQALVEKLDSCPVCKCKESRKLPFPVGRIGESAFGDSMKSFGLAKCAGCGVVYTNPRPGPELLGRFYSGDHYEPHSHVNRYNYGKLWDHLLGRLGSYLPSTQPIRFLDYGCGGGNLLEAASKRGWQVEGYEVSPRALRECAAHNLKATGNTDELPRGYFDGVLLNHVLEHVADYEGTFKVLRAVLKPQGVLFIAVPNAKSLRAMLALPALTERGITGDRFHSFPIHLAHFNAKSLKTLLSGHGFDPFGEETYGFGVQDLLMKKKGEAKAPAAAAAAGAGDGGWTKGPKGLVKKIFFSTLLGENLLVASRLR